MYHSLCLPGFDLGLPDDSLYPEILYCSPSDYLALILAQIHGLRLPTGSASGSLFNPCHVVFYSQIKHNLSSQNERKIDRTVGYLQTNTIHNNSWIYTMKHSIISFNDLPYTRKMQKANRVSTQTFLVFV